jgi:hypothetical protein
VTAKPNEETRAPDSLSTKRESFRYCPFVFRLSLKKTAYPPANTACVRFLGLRTPRWQNSQATANRR